jgi:hypothetical protein
MDLFFFWFVPNKMLQRLSYLSHRSLFSSHKTLLGNSNQPISTSFIFYFSSQPTWISKNRLSCENLGNEFSLRHLNTKSQPQDPSATPTFDFMRKMKEVVPTDEFPPPKLEHLIEDFDSFPNDSYSIHRMAKFVNGDGTLMEGGEEAIRQILEERKKASKINPHFAEYIRTVYDFSGSDKDLLIFAAAAIHAQLHGPTSKDDKRAIVNILPIVELLMKSEEQKPQQGLLSKTLLQSSEMEKAIISAMMKKVNPTVQKRKLKLSDLRYFKLYPKIIAKWIVDAKTPLGKYNFAGIWENVEITPKVYEGILAKQKVHFFFFSFFSFFLFFSFFFIFHFSFFIFHFHFPFS